MTSPPNLMAVSVVTYEYLFCLPSSDRLRPPTRRKAQGLWTGSCTLGYREALVTAQKSRYGRFPSAVNSWGTKYPVLDMVPPLLAKEEGPPT
jgi:hypothetical protein